MEVGSKVILLGGGRTGEIGIVRNLDLDVVRVEWPNGSRYWYHRDRVSLVQTESSCKERWVGW